MALTACAGAPAGDGGATDGSADGAETEPLPPSELVGLWRVDAESEDDETWLQVGSPSSAHDVTLWRECGWMSGSWLAGAGSLLVSLHSGSEDCVGDATDLEVDWLLATRGSAADGEGRLLLDAAGDVLATLTIDGEPPSHPDISDDYRTQPDLTEEESAALDARPEPLPDGLEPASAEEVLGRWVPTENYDTEPFIELLEDATWTGSDGCNGLGGRWLLDAESALLATSGPQTLIGCEGENLGSVLVDAAWLVVDGDTLTFYGPDGTEVGQAVRG